MNAGTKTVNCSAQLNGFTVSDVSTFTVVRPTDFVAATTGIVFLYTNEQLAFGGPPNQPGIQFSNTLIMPSMLPESHYNYGNTNYSTEWVQLITNQSATITISNSVTNVAHQLQTTGTVLDTVYPDPDFNSTTNVDDPFITLGELDETYASDTQSSKTWLMFRPANGNWVPMYIVTWRLTGAAIGYYPNWRLTGTNIISVIRSEDSGTNYPIWTDNSKNFDFIPAF